MPDKCPTCGKEYDSIVISGGGTKLDGTVVPCETSHFCSSCAQKNG